MKSLLVGLALLLAVVAYGCGGPASTPADETPGMLAAVPADYAGTKNPLGPEAAGAGAQLYQSNCEACHGPQGHGDGPAGVALEPAPRNLAELSKVASDDYLYWRISTGRPGTAMPPWQGVLTQEQIWQVVSYIRTLK
jgi:mono/diheme cytochrome c family protein